MIIIALEIIVVVVVVVVVIAVVVVVIGSGNDNRIIIVDVVLQGPFKICGSPCFGHAPQYLYAQEKMKILYTPIFPRASDLNAFPDTLDPTQSLKMS